MKVRLLYRGVSFFFTLLLTSIIPARAQVPTTGSLRGQVIDPSGSTVSGAAVLLTAPNGNSVDTVTNKDGFYEVRGLAPGTYTVKVVAEGFGLFAASNIAVKVGQVQTLKIALTLEEQKLEIHVEDSPTQLDVNPENNAGAIILKDKDLEALSDDPDELMDELQALAGPSAGPNGGQIYIDGFTAGQLPHGQISRTVISDGKHRGIQFAQPLRSDSAGHAATGLRVHAIQWKHRWTVNQEGLVFL
jgi:hypothetical protein